MFFIIALSNLQDPYIRLARGKFELTNQDSAGGKNSTAVYKSGIGIRQLFSLESGDKYPRKGIFNFKTILVGKK